MGYNYNRDFEINEEKTAEFLQNAVEKIITEEDIDTLTELIKLYKKNVPLTRRKYVVAYLLKEVMKHYRSFGRNNRDRNTERNNDNNRNNRNRTAREAKPEFKQPVAEAVVEAEEKPRHPRVEIDPDKATSIFVSIGKNRRVYPRDLVGLLVAVGGIDRERIGDIKVLANYSFVQLYTEDCQTAIDKLNGYDYRGRKLAVSFSRQKTEGEEDSVPADAPETNMDAAVDAEVTEMSAEDAAAYAAAEKAAADKEPFGNNL